MYKFLLADDHQIVLDGLKNMLEASIDCKILAAVNNGAEALDVLENVHVDLVILDLDMPIMGGLETLKKVKLNHPLIKVLILSMHSESAIIEDLKKCNADGYMVKNSSIEDLTAVIHKILNGEKHFQPIAKASFQPFNSNQKGMDNQINLLTQREKEIIKLVAQGYSNKEIAEQLNISHRTVDTHRTNLMAKLQIHNVAGIIRFAINHNLAD